MSGNGTTACPVYGKSSPMSCIGSYSLEADTPQLLEVHERLAELVNSSCRRTSAWSTQRDRRQTTFAGIWFPYRRLPSRARLCLDTGRRSTCTGLPRTEVSLRRSEAANQSRTCQCTHQKHETHPYNTVSSTHA